MERRFQIVWILSLVLGGGMVSADPLSLTVDQAVDLAVKNNLVLKGEDLQLQAKQRSKDYAWNAFIPKTSASTALAHLNQPSSLYSTFAQIFPQYNFSSPAWTLAASFS